MQKLNACRSKKNGVPTARWSASASALALLMWLGAASSAMAERIVVDLEPSEVVAFIRQNPKVVVQFTSPDRGCGYCVGADKMFTDGVKQLGMDGWKYVRVQWPRWMVMPAFEAPVKVLGVPDHQIYVDGAYKTSAGGRAKDAAALMAAIEGKINPPEPSPVPALTGDLRKGLRAYAVKKVLGQTFYECERNHFDNKPVLASKLHAWAGRNEGDLKLGTKAMFSTLGTNSHPYTDEMARETQAFQLRLSKEFAVDAGNPWSKEKCEALSNQLDRF